MTQKSQAEQNAEQRQKDLLEGALDKAREEGGVLLNASGKTAPALYPKESPVSAFNAIMLALHSDRGGYRTNQYTGFSGAKKRGEAVQSGEKGVPFVRYRWNEYRSKTDKDMRISAAEYDKLSPEEKKGFSAVAEREIRMLFNIEQTTLPIADREAFRKAVKEHGSFEERGIGGPEDKGIRMEVNRFLQNIAANLVPVRRDGIGIAHYDSSRDVVHLPSQKHFDSYPEYVQEAIRQVVTATGHPQRLSRPGMEMEGGQTPSESQKDRERLVVELVSAAKMNDLGLPSRLSPESRDLVDRWKKSIEENPRFIHGIEMDVNSAAAMIAKAERGEKIELRELPVREESQKATVSASVSMIRDDDGKWAVFIKPEAEKGFALYAQKEDVSRYFASAKRGGGQPDERFRQELAQKYYTLGTEHPEQRADLFRTKEKDLDLSSVEKASIVRIKADPEKNIEGRILCHAVIKGEKDLEPREVSPSQWQRLWLADDKEDYKKNLAATLFADVLRQKQQVEERKEQEEEKRMNSPEQKAKEEREEKAKEALTRAETKAVAAVALAGIVKDEEQQQSRGFHR
ncbi:MAG: DUF1738 domain-containing protein [Bacteroidales bacterium]|nr:DUF1738 domain-containing protein [Bacteroidales bacterium]